MSQTPSTPVDVATAETATFVAAHAAPRSRVLEVGCGEGHVAHETGRRGYRVIAIDSDPGSIETARARGVNAEVASWPKFASPTVDVVLFTRSLHHVHDLGGALHAVRSVLEPGGLLLVEDFAFHSADGQTIEWFLERVRAEPGRSLLGDDDSHFVTRLLRAEDPETAWHHDHDHDLHGFDTMCAAIAAELELVDTDELPYLYRYLVPALPQTEDAAAWVAQLLGEERGAVAAAAIRGIGRRIVARRRRE